jgi:hypothetical protein
MPSLASKKPAAVKEMQESLVIEAEINGDEGLPDNNAEEKQSQSSTNTQSNGYLNSNGVEVELEDKTHDEIVEIINKQNKIEAATDLEQLIQKKLQLPENVYIKATKDIEGHESIALRWKIERKRPFGGKIQQAVSLLNIYNTGTNAIWVGAFDDMFGKLPQEIEDLIYNVLDILGANKTATVEIYDLPENKEDIKKEEKPKDNKLDTDKDDKKDDDKEDKDDDNKDVEDNKENKDED